LQATLNAKNGHARSFQDRVYLADDADIARFAQKALPQADEATRERLIGLIVERASPSPGCCSRRSSPCSPSCEVINSL
jgi:hypothetical protein